MSMPLPVACPRCGESNRSGRPTCWVCDSVLAPPADVAAGREPNMEATSSSVFGSIVKILLISIAITAGVLGLGVVLLLVTCFGLIAASGGMK
jgi:hypothetical protein